MNPNGPSWEGFKFIQHKDLPEQVLDYIYNFTWVRDKTPLSALQWPICLCAIYVTTVYALYLYKKDRNPSNVNVFVAIHNFILVVMSASMCLGVLYAIFELVSKGATTFDLICDEDLKMAKGPVFFWCYMFYLSKYYEFVDTIFIVLKKKELTFLHLYHHCLIVFLTWIGMNTLTTNQWVGVFLNTFVHVCMYYYYFLAAIGKTVWWKKHLTTMQMVQFCIVVSVLFYWLFLDFQNQPKGCSGELWSFGLCLFGQITFLALFYNFYSHTYKGKKEQ